jgi:2-iminobutanoate/2-iminopropanoate deaminase
VDKVQINPWSWQDRAGFSQAWRVSDVTSLIFIAGQAPISADGELVGAGDFDAQAEQVFLNLGTVLEQAGADFSAVVKIGVYLTDVSKLPDFGRIKARHIPGPQPASTAIGVTALALPGMMVEVEAFAALP